MAANPKSTDKDYQSIDVKSVDNHPLKTKTSTAKIVHIKSKFSKFIQFIKKGSKSESIKEVSKVNIGDLSKEQIKEKHEKADSEIKTKETKKKK